MARHQIYFNILYRDGQNPFDSPRPNLGGFCAYFSEFGLKFPKLVRVRSGLGFTEYFYAGTRPAPFLPTILLNLKKPWSLTYFQATTHIDLSLSVIRPLVSNYGKSKSKSKYFSNNNTVNIFNKISTPQQLG